MPAFLDHPPVLQDQNSIGVNHGRQAVRDHDDRPPFRHLVQALLDFLLGLGVKRGRCFVEEQNRRIFQDGTRNADPLFFTAGKLEATFSDGRSIAFRKTDDKIVDPRGPGRGLDLLACREMVTIGDVVTDGLVEKDRILGNNPDLVVQAALRNIPNILTVNPDASRVDIIESEQEAPDRGLPGS